MAVVGQGYAVVQSGAVHLKGALAWMAWATIHVLFLAQPALRLRVFMPWVWTFFTGQRGARLIVKHRASGGLTERPDVPQAAGSAR
jgi:NADH dehydrogenase